MICNKKITRNELLGVFRNKKKNNRPNNNNNISVEVLSMQKTYRFKQNCFGLARIINKSLI